MKLKLPKVTLHSYLKVGNVRLVETLEHVSTYESVHKTCCTIIGYYHTWIGNSETKMSRIATKCDIIHT